MAMRNFSMVISGKKADIKRAVDLLQADKKLLFKCVNNSYISIFERRDTTAYVPNDYDVIDGADETRLVFSENDDNGTFEGIQYLAKKSPELEIIYRECFSYGHPSIITVKRYKKGKANFSRCFAEIWEVDNNTTVEELDEIYRDIWVGYDYVETIEEYEEFKKEFRKKIGMDYDTFDNMCLGIFGGHYEKLTL